MGTHTVGLVIGAFKPYTKGHHFLIETAARENDVVHLFVSQKDRKRKGEYAITWEKMQVVWAKYIKPILPANVVVHYEQNPLVALHNFLVLHDYKLINEDQKFTLYADDNDKKRYCYEDRQLEQKFPRLFKKDAISTKTFERAKNVDVSATKMRKTLEMKEFGLFKQLLPEVLEPQASEIFELFLVEP